jgi:hypothetical protein
MVGGIIFMGAVQWYIFRPAAFLPSTAPVAPHRDGSVSIAVSSVPTAAPTSNGRHAHAEQQLSPL